MLTSANGDISLPIVLPWVSFGSLIVGAVLSWVAFVFGWKAGLELGNRYTSAGPFLIIWLVKFWLPGILPATIVAWRAVTRSIWNAENQSAAT